MRFTREFVYGRLLSVFCTGVRRALFRGYSSGRRRLVQSCGWSAVGRFRRGGQLALVSPDVCPVGVVASYCVRVVLDRRSEGARSDPSIGSVKIKTIPLVS